MITADNGAVVTVPIRSQDNCDKISIIMDGGRRKSKYQKNNRACTFQDSFHARHPNAKNSETWKQSVQCEAVDFLLVVTLITILSFWCPCPNNFNKAAEKAEFEESVKKDLIDMSIKLKQLRKSYTAAEIRVSKLAWDMARLQEEVKILNEMINLSSDCATSSINSTKLATFMGNSTTQCSIYR